MNDSGIVFVFMNMMLIVMAIGLTVTIIALCTMLVRSIYRDWDRL
jgi:hypothetical protein